MEDSKEYSLTINSKYKGRILDTILIKLKETITMFCFGLFLLIFGLCFFFASVHSTGLAQEGGVGIVCIIMGAIVLLISPLNFLVLGVNKFFLGEIKYTFIKTKEGSYSFKIEGTKFNKPYEFNGCLQNIKVSKRYAEISTAKSQVFYLPFSAMKKEDAEYINTIEKEIKDKRK